MEDLKDIDKVLLENISLEIPPHELINKFKDLPNYAENSYIDDLILDNIDYAIKKLFKDNPGLNKQQLIEKLIGDNQDHKDKILSVVNRTMDEQINIWKDKLPKDKFEKAMKILEKEDLDEKLNLSRNISIDQIKTLKSINKSHNNLLESIKSKVSKSNLSDTINPDSTESIEKIANEANLFD